MANFRLLGGLFLLAIAGGMSCTQNTLHPPEPAQSLAGVYQAQFTPFSFHVNGDSLTLTIKAVANNTIDVVIRSKSGDSLSYKKALVLEEFGHITRNKGCISYRSNLSSNQHSDVMSMTCAEEHVINYLYTPTGQTATMIAKFKKI